MAEEKEQKKTEEVKKEVVPAEKAEVKKEGKAPEQKEEAPKASEKKGKKVSQMTLAEVEAELKTVKEKMGGFRSAFAQHLLGRKKELTGSSARS